MNIKLQDKHKHICIGTMFVCFGLFFLLSGFNYDMGTVTRMGPGLYPSFLSVVLIVIGLFSFLNYLKRD